MVVMPVDAVCYPAQRDSSKSCTRHGATFPSDRCVVPQSHAWGKDRSTPQERTVDFKELSPTRLLIQHDLRYRVAMNPKTLGEFG